MYGKRFAILLLALALFTSLILTFWLFFAEVPIAIVKCNSMLPLLREGDIVFIVKASPEDIWEGDVIVYRTKYNTLIIHRVTEVLSTDGKYYYVTQGDNNSLPDYRYFDDNKGIPYDRVVGKVLSFDRILFKVPYIGNLALMLRGESCA